MFGLGFWEISVVLVIALIVLGPKKLPEMAKTIGKGIREFRGATEDFRATVDQEISAPERRELPLRAPPAPAPSHNETDAEVEPVPPSAGPTTDEPKAGVDSTTAPKTPTSAPTT